MDPNGEFRVEQVDGLVRLIIQTDDGTMRSIDVSSEDAERIGVSIIRASGNEPNRRSIEEEADEICFKVAEYAKRVK